MKALLWITTLTFCAASGNVAAAASPHKPIDTLMTRARETHSDSMIVLRDGKVLAQYYGAGSPPGPIELMSATKSIVALGVGLLLRDGKLASLDTPVCEFYPEWKQGRKAHVTVRMLMNQTSGLQNVPNTTVEIYPSQDVVQLALAAELDSEPGARFSYNNKATNLLAALIGRIAGMPIDKYLQRELFDPLDIHPGEWDRDKAGNPYGMSGLPLSAVDAAKLGQLVLDEGYWRGKRLLPADFVQTMLAPTPGITPEYGLLWWRAFSWTHYNVDEESIVTLRNAQVDDAAIAKISALSGRKFENLAGLANEIKQALGQDSFDELRTRMSAHGIGFGKAFHVQLGPVAAFNANGYLGQYIVIVPDAHIVAVRQIAESDKWQDSDEYDDFVANVIALSETFKQKR